MALRYTFNIGNNTNEQCKIMDKQIFDGDASFHPEDDQTINNGGANANMTVVASSGDIRKFRGKFQLQFLSMTYNCDFSFERGKGATFEAKPEGSGTFTTNDPKATIEGTTANIDLNITG